MRFPIGLKASLSASMVALALGVSLVAFLVHGGLLVDGTVRAALERADAVAHQAALLTRRAQGRARDPARVTVDRALRSLFDSALAGDPTLADLGVFDARGVALAHSQPEREGRVTPRRAPVARLRGNTATQALRLLGDSRVFETVVPLSPSAGSAGEVRVGVSTALLRDQLLDSLRAAAWVLGVALVLAVIVALGFAQILARRVRTVMAGLQRLREGEFGHRLRVEGQDELALLASSINALGERLEATRARAAAGEMDEGELLRATGEVSAWAKVASGLAHELADPLNAAALHLGQLKRKWTNPEPEAARHLRVLEDELKRLESIVLGFRRFSMLGEMRAEWFDLEVLLHEVVERARETRQDRRVEVHLHWDGAPKRFYGDPSLLRQAIANLLANADQAMPSGGRIEVACRGVPGMVEIAVTDGGVGIPEEAMGRVFDLYFTTKEAGSGIGLAVVQQVVQLHGGRTHLRSSTGEGTQVTLELPLQAPQPKHLPQAVGVS